MSQNSEIRRLLAGSCAVNLVVELFTVATATARSGEEALHAAHTQPGNITDYVHRLRCPIRTSLTVIQLAAPLMENHPKSGPHKLWVVHTD